MRRRTSHSQVGADASPGPSTATADAAAPADAAAAGAATAGASSAAPSATPSAAPAASIPYSRKVLIKFLLRAVAISVFSQVNGAGGRPAVRASRTPHSACKVPARPLHPQRAQASISLRCWCWCAPPPPRCSSQEADSTLLYKCLRVLFEKAQLFGGSLFALASGVMADAIHHDPLCYRALDEAGLPEAFINSVKVRGERSRVFGRACPRARPWCAIS